MGGTVIKGLFCASLGSYGFADWVVGVGNIGLAADG
jgi:hypothetical protein